MNYNFDREDEILIVRLEGEFVVGRSDDFMAKILKNLDKNITTIVVDFTNVKFIDSSGIGQLLTVLKEFHKKNISIKICSLNKTIQNIFKKLNIYSFFEIYEDCEEAIAYS